jgi:hypothetical protein
VGLSRQEEDLVSPRYEIRFAGRPNQDASDAFAGLDLACDGRFTVVSGELDQAALHGVLERVRALGLVLIDARRARGRSARPGRSDRVDRIDHIDR